MYVIQTPDVFNVLQVCLPDYTSKYQDLKMIIAI